MEFRSSLIGIAFQWVDHRLPRGIGALDESPTVGAAGPDVSVSVLALSVTVALLVIAAWMSMQLLDGIRAYVGGEGLYSKGQKQAVFLLTDYMYSGEERSYREFKAALTIPQGDRRARIELEKENPNWKIVRDGFLAGGNHPEDIDDLILLFRRFRYVPFVSDAVAVWTEGDAYVAKLNDLGAKVHSQWQQQSFSAAQFPASGEV